MFNKWLIRKLVKDSKNVENPDVRGRYTSLAGIIGMLVNLLLFIIKFSVGQLVGSIAIMADAFNNLSDIATSAIMIVGIKLANRPADKEHPYGHGRLEYISALIVAALVLVFGFQLAGASFERILNPEPVFFDWLSFSLLFLSVLLKVYLSRLNKYMGQEINSSALKAVSVDALGDVLISGTVLLSFSIAPFISLNIDGYVGVGVALFIIYMGYKLIKETLGPLLGEAPDPQMVTNITEAMLSYPHIIGVHDLIIHNYGVGRTMASIHAEIPANLDIMEIHDVIDQAEREISEKLNLHLVVHMDPVSVETPETKTIKLAIQQIIEEHPVLISMHDFRVIGNEDHKKIAFDLVVDGNQLIKELTENSIKEEVIKKIKENHSEYHCIIIIDRHFTQGK